MHNPKALKFNVSKKLGQLMKVIQLFEGQIADREFQIQYLHSTIDPQINQYLDDYKTSIEKFNSTVDSERDESQKKIEKLYNHKYQTLKDDASAYINAANDNLEKYQEKVLDDLVDLQKQIKQVMNGVGNKTLAIETYCDKAKGEIDKQIKKLQETYVKEVEVHDAESKKKLSALEQQSNGTIESLKKEHAKKMGEVRSAFSGKGESQPSIVDKMRQLKNHVDHMRKNLNETRGNVKQLILQRKENGSEDKKRLREVANSIEDIIKSHKSAIEKIKSDTSNSIERHKADIEMKNHDCETMEIKHELDLQKAESRKRETIESFEAEYEDAQNRLKSTFNNFGDTVKELMEKHKLELEKISDNHEKAVKEAEIKLNQKHKDILAIQEEQAREFKRTTEQLEEAKKMHERDIKSLSQSQMKDINIENEKFNQISKEIQDKIDNCMQGGNQELKGLKDSLQGLRDEKENIMSEYTEKVNKFEEIQSKTISELQNLNQTEITKMKEEKTTSMKNKNSKYNEEFEQKKKELEEELNKTQNKNAEEFNRKIEEIEETRKERSEKEKLEQKRKSEYDVEESKLKGIQAPDIDNNPMFQKFEMIIKELDEQKMEVDKIICIQKKNLEEEWKTKYEKENERHSMHVVRSSMGTEREQKRLALLQEIGDIKQEQKNEEQNLNDILSQHRNEHNQAMKKLRTELQKSKDMEEIERLKEELEKKQNDRDQRQNNSISVFESKCQDYRTEISEENDNHENELEKIKKKKQEMEGKFESMIREIDNRKKESEESSEKACNEFIYNSDNKIKNITQIHIDEMNNFINEYEKLKDQLIKSNMSFQKKMKDNRAQNQSSLDEFSRSSEGDLEKRSKDWIEMRKFYEEKISVLTNKREEAIHQFEQRPPRQSEIDIIEKLQLNLQTRTMQLKNGIKELTEYRTMLIKQEKEYNSRFGKGPKVGILSTTKAGH